MNIPSWILVEGNTIPLTAYFYTAEIKQLLKDTIFFFSQKYNINLAPISFCLVEGIKPSCLSSSWGNDRFKLGRADVGFKIWQNNGLTKTGDLYDEGV